MVIDLKKLEAVRLARSIITSYLATNLFTEAQVTTICGWLGFDDTAFRDKLAYDKLDDYLLDEFYWLQRPPIRQ